VPQCSPAATPSPRLAVGESLALADIGATHWHTVTHTGSLAAWGTRGLTGINWKAGRNLGKPSSISRRRLNPPVQWSSTAPAYCSCYSEQNGQNQAKCTQSMRPVLHLIGDVPAPNGPNPLHPPPPFAAVQAPKGKPAPKNKSLCPCLRTGRLCFVTWLCTRRPLTAPHPSLRGG
jgi:hypothetical protein